MALLTHQRAGSKPGLRTSQAIAVAGAAALVALAMANMHRARAAERRHPPMGRFIEVDGVRLHFVDRGSGTPLILLHGNGSAIEDFETSGLIELASKRHRVIAFDRPGFGHSTRPRGRLWTAAAQAQLIRKAALRLGLSRYLVLGHSFGAAVALDIAAKHPADVSGLILVSGYFYPSPRVDALVLGTPALPGLGQLLRYTVLPPISRLAWPFVLRKIFGPAKIPARFSAIMRDMALRPSQLRATSAESALVMFTALARKRIPDDAAFSVGIVTGAEDRVVDAALQSQRLHRNLPGSLVHSVAGAGHMVHHHAPADILSMIDRVAGQKAPMR